jgi:hypothetical protein
LVSLELHFVWGFRGTFYSWQGIWDLQKNEERDSWDGFMGFHGSQGCQLVFLYGCCGTSWTATTTHWPAQRGHIKEMIFLAAAVRL